MYSTEKLEKVTEIRALSGAELDEVGGGHPILAAIVLFGEAAAIGMVWGAAYKESKGTLKGLDGGLGPYI